MKEHELIQIGRGNEEKLVENTKFNLPMIDLRDLIMEADLFISVDNFFPHFCHYYGRSGAVIFSKSDPNIYGYPENLNLLKDRKYLRHDQFGLWESCDFDPESFLLPEEIKKYLVESRFFSIL